MAVLGIDIGGTNIEFGIVSEDGNIRFQQSVATSLFHSPEEILLYIRQILKDRNTDYHHIGIGVPNGNSQTGEIQHAPNLPWKGIIPLREIAENIFKKQTYVTNDANAAAFGEMLYGHAKDLSNFVTITLGTGLGSGIVINKEVLTGGHGIAGEFGHIRVIREGRKCNCGRYGCLERYASATGMLESFRELQSPSKANSSLFLYPDLTAKDIFEEASKGDVFSMEIVEYTASVLGNALADFAAFSDPEAFILFGGIARSGPLFISKVQNIMDDNLLNIYKGKVDLRVSGLHNVNVAILGAAASATWQFSNRNKS